MIKTQERGIDLRLPLYQLSAYATTNLHTTVYGGNTKCCNLTATDSFVNLLWVRNVLGLVNPLSRRKEGNVLINDTLNTFY